ncbi:MAG: hypothetical protein JGK17_22700 [Microcoleus sp. PH2017_10_PVI_O_A]|uniref:hypothetical protein n=1 Tax=unclassified Microcoleus TaxID=2642155 RepID=UPI001D7644FB|nr:MULTISPECIES: hypothetical protein [unclassified Microcoleus]MCC3408345.1 hypothetical protein [Microcoleus sp. PH2017_10_PVI_O_A]MCC3462404.1 hypothetical protein [Microcoleus sp. PH2017_11_PCY_U_A]MCC3480894.1 hypothetical protein [Microcoleus sp. PH2017_12_PCY_D_A]MCC3527689.1 hypothetical protein [Microcoleus sp. PH2017_21_RUC_O_A]MCC3539791.1 hypothetical protein [Microcoleus sp. PH2017_22_RUC_O_B]
MIYPFWVLVVSDRGQYSTTRAIAQPKSIALSLKSDRATDKKSSYRIEGRATDILNY